MRFFYLILLEFRILRSKNDISVSEVDLQWKARNENTDSRSAKPSRIGKGVFSETRVNSFPKLTFESFSLHTPGKNKNKTKKRPQLLTDGLICNDRDIQKAPVELPEIERYKVTWEQKKQASRAQSIEIEIEYEDQETMIQSIGMRIPSKQNGCKQSSRGWRIN